MHLHDASLASLGQSVIRHSRDKLREWAREECDGGWGGGGELAVGLIGARGERHHGETGGWVDLWSGLPSPRTPCTESVGHDAKYTQSPVAHLRMNLSDTSSSPGLTYTVGVE